MQPREILLIVFVGAGLLLAGISAPMILKVIPPNPFYGFRVPKTMNNPEIWYAINTYSGWWLFAAGLLEALSAAALYILFPGFDKDLYASAQGVVMVVLLTAAMIASFNRLKTM